MAEKRRAVAIWLGDEYARLIVGAPRRNADADEPASRWTIQGAIVEDLPGVGMWMKADTVEEFRPQQDGTVKQVNWIFKSSQLLVRWDGIITIQAFDEGPKDIGFRPE